MLEMTDSMLYAVVAILGWTFSLMIAYREGRMSGMIRARDLFLNEKATNAAWPWTARE